MASTIHDVARVAGVSMKTVSNVLNHHPHVRPGTRDRVLAAIAELEYRPNLSARGLRKGRTDVIGLVVPSVKENYFAELADAVIRAARDAGLAVLIEQTDGDRDEELRAVSGSARPQFLDGMLFSPVSLGQEDVDALNSRVPVVLLGERIFDGPTDHVVMQNTAAASAAVDHLLDIGRRRVAVLGARMGDSEVGSASLRLRGYFSALEAAGIPVDPRLVLSTPRWDRAAGAAAVRTLLREGVPFDAVFALNDTLGLGALRALGSAGIDVPGDVALIGFDNIDESRYSVPSMSTVDTGREEIAATAVELLIERMAERETHSPPRTITPDFRVVARESTGFTDPG